MGRPWCVLRRSVRKDIEQKVHLLLYQCTDRKWSSILQWSMHRQEAGVQLHNSNANKALQSALKQIQQKKLMVDNHLHAISSMASDTSRLSKIIMDELGAEMNLAKTGGRAHSWMASICNTRMLGTSPLFAFIDGTSVSMLSIPTWMDAFFVHA